MANRGRDPSHAEILDDWYRRAWAFKLLLPADFRSETVGARKERLWCEKTTNEYLTMRDSVQRKTLTVAEARQYSPDINYRPLDFKKKTLKLINNYALVRHSPCRGEGSLSCPTRMRCGRCGGRGRRDENCGTCFGNGRIHKDHFNFGSRDPWDNSGDREYARCGTCGGSGKRTVTCRDCNRGEVICNRCNGRGFVRCEGCGGAGEVVNGDIVTRTFSPRQEISYTLSGLGRNEFKNGLLRKHFDSLAGDLKHSTFRNPTAVNIVLDRETIHFYRILSYHFAYKGNLFWLNLVSSGTGRKYVAGKLPFSKVKLSVISVTIGIIVASAIASVVLLN